MDLGNVKGNIFDIQRFSIHDGPGIRTNVFMKGCPLGCLWCHNPESRESSPELAFYAQKCIGCGACAAHCPAGLHAASEGAREFRRDHCVRCGSCARECVTGALAMIGREASAAEVLAEVKKDEIFYKNSGGGMTLSGGEPFYQPEFTLALLELAKLDGLHVCVETCGAAPFDTLAAAARFIDIFLYDIKEMDPARHKEFTGADNRLILENLRKLDGAGASIVLRCPVIPGLNDNENHLAQVCDLANSLKNIDHIDVEPYHPLGISKAEAIGKQPGHADSKIPPKDFAAGWADFMKDRTAIPVLVS